MSNFEDRKILVVEDNSERIKFFKTIFSSASVLVFAENYNQAVSLLDNDFDLVFLDHDLEEEHYTGNSLYADNTGYSLAEYIIENDLLLKAVFIVHSLNPIGSQNIVNCLQKCRVVFKIPFSKEVLANIEDNVYLELILKERTT